MAVPDLKPFDSVVYSPRHVTGRGWDPEACLYHGEERGTVKRVEGDHAFVWFHAGGTAARCELRDLHADTREERQPAWWARHLERTGTAS